MASWTTVEGPSIESSNTAGSVAPHCRYYSVLSSRSKDFQVPKMPFVKFAAIAVLGLVFIGCGTAGAAPSHSIALHGTPLYADNFEAFPYVNPSAPKGGRLTLGVLGSFENLNPFIVQGVPASGIREFVVESLMARSLDEPFTLYGLLAETIDVADDRKSVTFTLNPAAKFSDRQPVTPEDVITSFELLKTKGRPNHRTYFAKVTKAEKIGERGVRFTFEDASDRELPLILGLMPVFAAHATTPEKFETSSMTPLVGSGPYTVSRVDAGRSISFAAIRTIGDAIFPSIAAASTSTKSASTISATRPSCSKPSSPAPSI